MPDTPGTPGTPGAPPVPVVPLNQAQPAQPAQPAKPAVPVTPTPTAVKSTAPTRKAARMQLQNIIIDKGAAIVSLMVEDSEGIGTVLPDKVIPGWSASDPRVALTPSADGLKVTVTPGKADAPINGIMLVAKATLPDGTVLSAGNKREPLNVVSGTSGLEMQVAIVP